MGQLERNLKLLPQFDNKPQVLPEISGKPFNDPFRITGAQSSNSRLVPELSLITLRQIQSSFFRQINASPAATRSTRHNKLEITLIRDALPISPVSNSSKSGRCRSNNAVPRQPILSCTPPVKGASSNVTRSPPRFSILLISSTPVGSTMCCPVAWQPEPAVASHYLSDAAGDGRQVITVSHLCARSTTEVAATAPCRLNPLILEESRSLVPLSQPTQAGRQAVPGQ